MTPRIPETDAVSLLCGLSEASADGFLAAELTDKYGIFFPPLIALGAVKRGALLRTVTCRACHADHPATLDYDAATRRHFHFCPEAGFVTVNDAELATFRFDPEWLVEWLTRELPILHPIRRRAVVPNLVWHLGDAKCGETLLTVVLARKVSSQVALDHLASALRAIPPADIGVVITSSPDAARQVRLPHGYEFLDLREIGRSEEDRLVLDNTKLGFWIKGTRSDASKPKKSRSGRPSVRSFIENLYNERREEGVPMLNISAEAKVISNEFRKRMPDEVVPHMATIRRHVSEVSARVR